METLKFHTEQAHCRQDFSVTKARHTRLLWKWEMPPPKAAQFGAPHWPAAVVIWCAWKLASAEACRG